MKDDLKTKISNISILIDKPSKIKKSEKKESKQNPEEFIKSLKSEIDEVKSIVLNQIIENTNKREHRLDMLQKSSTKLRENCQEIEQKTKKTVGQLVPRSWIDWKIVSLSALFILILFFIVMTALYIAHLNVLKS